MVEMLIAMTIFVAFTGILINSYTSIVRSQRETNEYRDMYVQSRQIFETLIQELRDGMVDYPKVATTGPHSDEIFLISKDAASKTRVFYEDNTVKLSKKYLAQGNNPGLEGSYGIEDTIFLNSLDESGVKVTKFRLYFSPAVDPYDPVYVSYDSSQFHPRVTIYAEFEKELSSGKKYSMFLQTTVSSRVYNQVYPTEYIYTNIK